jgi:ribonuclease P/MRP protein subunit POP5
MKEKPLQPTLREKKRYIVYEILSKTPLSFQDISKALTSSIKSFIGELGCAKAGIIILNKTKNNRGILKVSHKSMDEVKAALTLIKEINDQKVIVKTIKTSGVLNKALNYMEG